MMNNMRKLKGQPQINTISFYEDPKYRGKYVIIIGKEIFSTRSGRTQNELLEKLIKKYPKEKPLVTYIPKEDTLILLL